MEPQERHLTNNKRIMNNNSKIIRGHKLKKKATKLYSHLCWKSVKNATEIF